MAPNIWVCRFIDWLSQSVDCLAFSGDSSFLGVGRSNGNVNIYETSLWHHVLTLRGGLTSSVSSIIFVAKQDTPNSSQGLTTQQKKYTKNNDDTADTNIHHSNLVIDRPHQLRRLTRQRLFTTGLHGQITEWDLCTQLPKAIVSSGSGSIFNSCLSHGNDRIAIACEDGSVKIIRIDNNIYNDSNLEVVVTLPRHSSRILSISYGSTDDVIFCGTSNGLLMKWLWSTKTCICKAKLMNLSDSTGKENKGGRLSKGGVPNECLVWAIEKITKHRLIATGDSRGFVTLWDENTCTVLQRFKQHQEDVLDLAIGTSQDIIYSVGVDGRLTHYSLTIHGAGQWVVTGFRYPQNNDVKAVATASRGLVATGGVAGTVVTYSGLTNVMDMSVKPNSIPRFTAMSSQQIAIASRHNSNNGNIKNLNSRQEPPVILVQQMTSVEIWSLSEITKSSDTGLVQFDDITTYNSTINANETTNNIDVNLVSKNDDIKPNDIGTPGTTGTTLTANLTITHPNMWNDYPLPAGYPVKCAEIRLKDSKVIKTSSLSTNGDFIVIGDDTTGITCYQFDISELEINEISLSHLKLQSIYSVKFINNDIFAVSVKSTKPRTILLGQSDDTTNESFSVKLIDVRLRKEIYCFKDFPNAINRLETSPNGRYIGCVDIEGKSFLLDVNVKTQVCMLPVFEEGDVSHEYITCLVFNDIETHVFVISSGNRFYIYDITNQKRLHLISDDGPTYQIPHKMTSTNIRGQISSAVWTSQIKSSSNTGSDIIEERLLCQLQDSLVSVTFDSNLIRDADGMFVERRHTTGVSDDTTVVSDDTTVVSDDTTGISDDIIGGDYDLGSRWQEVQRWRHLGNDATDGDVALTLLDTTQPLGKRMCHSKTILDEGVSIRYRIIQPTANCVALMKVPLDIYWSQLLLPSGGLATDNSEDNNDNKENDGLYNILDNGIISSNGNASSKVVSSCADTYAYVLFCVAESKLSSPDKPSFNRKRYAT